MRKMLPIRLVGILVMLCIPGLAYCCLTFDSFSATASGNCAVSLTWAFEECSEAGIYYIEYSSDGGNTFNIIATTPSVGATGTANLSYTDNYAHSSGSGSTTVEYRIVFVVSNTQSTHFSTVSSVALGSSSCGNNNVTRCNSLPSGLSISGGTVLCPPASGNFSLSSSVPTLWTISSGGSLVTTSTPTYGGGITVTNSSTNGNYATLTTNVEGCLNLSTQISLGVPPAFDYYLSPSVDPICINTLGNWVTIEPETLPVNVSLEWGYIDEEGSGGTVVVNSNGGISQDFTFSTASLYQLYARGRNACGYFEGNTETLNIEAEDCSGSGGGGLAARKDTLSASAALPAVSGDRLSVYPNPATDAVTIRLPDSVSLNQAFIRVIDLLGRPLKLIKVNTYTTTVDMTGLGSGLYLIEIGLGRSTIIKKVIKR